MAAPRLIGMIHVRALPGTPVEARPLADTIATAAAEARQLAAAGFDGLLIENMHDTPYLKGRVGPEIVAAMTAVGLAVRAAAPGAALGVQVLAGANRAALAVALACGAGFIRAENFAFAHVADEGLMPTADAGRLLRFRRRIGATAIRVYADIKKKHSAHAITADVDLAETARAAEFMRADGLIVTGTATGRAASIDDVRAAKAAAGVPVWVGSGVTADNLPELWPLADGFIVGSALKQDGHWAGELDPARVRRLADVARRLRGG